jgi:hypothetical protein
LNASAGKPKFDGPGSLSSLTSGNLSDLNFTAGQLKDDDMYMGHPAEIGESQVKEKSKDAAA